RSRRPGRTRGRTRIGRHGGRKRRAHRHRSQPAAQQTAAVMAKSTEIVGTGITARPVTRYSDDDIPPAFDAFARQWNEAVAKAGSPFGATVLNVEQACRRILADAGNGRFVADSSEDYARRTLRAIDSTKASIACGDADMAARMAVDVGRLITEADIKGRWE